MRSPAGAGTSTAVALGMAKHRRKNKSQDWVVFVLVIQWTVVFCGFMAALVVLMLH